MEVIVTQRENPRLLVQSRVYADATLTAIGTLRPTDQLRAQISYTVRLRKFRGHKQGTSSASTVTVKWS